MYKVLISALLLAASPLASLAVADDRCLAPTAENQRADELLQKVREGDCSAVPAALDAVKQQHAAIQRMRARCPDAARRHHDLAGAHEDWALWEKHLREQCFVGNNDEITEQDLVELGVPLKHPPTAPSVVSPSQNPTPPSQYSGQSQSASCSDITGLGGPALTNCNAGNAALTEAQELSRQNPVAARAKYQEAADSYRRAGDVTMANAIIAQMNALVATLPSNAPSQAPSANQAPPIANPEPVLTPSDRPAERPCGPSLQQAAPLIDSAEVIQKNDRTCPGFAAAASKYREAGTIFLGAIPTDTARGALADSCEYKKSQDMFARSTALDNLVDRMKREGRCDKPRVATTPGPDKSEKDRCDSDQSALDQLQKMADAMPNMTTAGGKDERSKDAQAIDQTVSRKRIELASQGCKKADALPPTPLECTRAEQYWGQTENLSKEELRARSAKAGCP